VKTLLIAAAGALALASPAAAARHDNLPLHHGSSGVRVAALQWMLAGHRPNVFTKIKGTFVGKPTGYFGARTGHATFAYKYRLGYPAKYNSEKRPVAGPYFFALLRGTKVRHTTWVALAAARVKAIEPGFTTLALKVKAYEVHLLDVGVQEQPVGSNRGPRISYSVGNDPALQSATGAYGVAWCVSTQQTVFKYVGYGTFADDTAGVYYAVDYARQRNWLSAKAKVGALIAFIDYGRSGRIPGTGHMGYVTKVTASGFSYIAGNDADGVHERFIDFGSRTYVFIYLPGLTE